MKRKIGVGNNEEGVRQEPRAVVLKELEVRAVEPEEMERVREVLGKEHYLGAGREVGRTLVQVVHHRGHWVAVLTWGPAAMKLVDREEMIGCSLNIRSEVVASDILTCWENGRARNQSCHRCALEPGVLRAKGPAPYQAGPTPKTKHPSVCSLRFHFFGEETPTATAALSTCLTPRPLQYEIIRKNIHGAQSKNAHSGLDSVAGGVMVPDSHYV